MSFLGSFLDMTTSRGGSSSWLESKIENTINHTGKQNNETISVLKSPL
jgi:hypothetical protein